MSPYHSAIIAITDVLPLEDSSGRAIGARCPLPWCGKVAVLWVNDDCTEPLRFEPCCKSCISASITGVFRFAVAKKFKEAYERKIAC